MNLNGGSLPLLQSSIRNDPLGWDVRKEGSHEQGEGGGRRRGDHMSRMRERWVGRGKERGSHEQGEGVGGNE